MFVDILLKYMIQSVMIPTVKPIEIDGEKHLLELLEIGTFEQFTAMRDLYLKNVHGFILVYSIVNLLTFQEILQLYEEILRVLHKDNIPLVLVGNKCDLRDEREVSTETAQEFAEKVGCSFLEVSAKTKINLDQVFY